MLSRYRRLLRVAHSNTSGIHLMKNSLGVVVGCVALLAAAAPRATAQVALGYTDVGAVIGIGNLGPASLAFGGRFEKVFKKLPDLGNGLLGIEVSADVYSWSSSSYSLRYVPVAGTANYHFHIDPKNKVDLFLGAGLGFLVASCSYKGNLQGASCGGYGSNLYFVGRAGGRYFFTPSLAAYADLGAGAATVNLGLMFKLK
jgi:hypothetical protein